jgi:hypothetical protein
MPFSLYRMRFSNPPFVQIILCAVLSTSKSRWKTAHQPHQYLCRPRVAPVVPSSRRFSVVFSDWRTFLPSATPGRLDHRHGCTASASFLCRNTPLAHGTINAMAILRILHFIPSYHTSQHRNPEPTIPSSSSRLPYIS